MALESGDGVIVEAGGDIAGSKDMVGREPQIEIALPAMAGIVDEERAMAEPFEDGELEDGGLEGGLKLLVCDFGALPALGVAGQVLIDA